MSPRAAAFAPRTRRSRSRAALRRSSAPPWRGPPMEMRRPAAAATRARHRAEPRLAVSPCRAHSKLATIAPPVGCSSGPPAARARANRGRPRPPANASIRALSSASRPRRWPLAARPPVPAGRGAAASVSSASGGPLRRSRRAPPAAGEGEAHRHRRTLHAARSDAPGTRCSQAPMSRSERVPALSEDAHVHPSASGIREPSPTCTSNPAAAQAVRGPPPAPAMRAQRVREGAPWIMR